MAAAYPVPDAALRALMVAGTCIHSRQCAAFCGEGASSVVEMMKKRAVEMSGRALESRFVALEDGRIAWRERSDALSVPDACVAYLAATSEMPRLSEVACLLPGAFQTGVEAVYRSVLGGEAIVVPTGPGRNMHRREQVSSPLQLCHFVVVPVCMSDRVESEACGMFRVSLLSAGDGGSMGTVKLERTALHRVGGRSQPSIRFGDTIKMTVIPGRRRCRRGGKGASEPTPAADVPSLVGGCVLGFWGGGEQKVSESSLFPVHRLGGDGEVRSAGTMTGPAGGPLTVSLSADSPMIKYLTALTAGSRAQYVSVTVVSGAAGCYEDAATFAERLRKARLASVLAMQKARGPASRAGAGAGAGGADAGGDDAGDVFRDEDGDVEMGGESRVLQLKAVQRRVRLQNRRGFLSLETSVVNTGGACKHYGPRRVPSRLPAKVLSTTEAIRRQMVAMRRSGSAKTRSERDALYAWATQGTHVW